MAADHPDELFDRLQPAANRSGAPAVEVGLRQLGRLVVEGNEVQAPPVGPGGCQL